MKVVILVECFSPITGGGERQMEALGKALQRHGVDVHIVTRRFLGTKEYEEIDGLPVHRLSLPVSYRGNSIFKKLARKLNLVGYLLAVLKLIKLDQSSHQIVIVQTGISQAAIARLPLASSLSCAFSRNNTKVVLKPWNRRYLKRSLQKSNKVLREEIEKDSILLSTLFHFVQDRTISFVAITEPIYKELIENGVPERKITKIPNGVDTNTFLPIRAIEKEQAKASLGLSSKKIVIYVGSLKRQKGLNVLLNSWQKVSRARKDTHLLIVGRTSPREEFEYLSNLAQQIGVADSMTFTGETQQVLSYLSAADLFVLPSFLEGFSNALLEALSCGLPVIVTDIPGVGEAITHGVNGFIVPPGDVKELANSMIALLNDEKLAFRMGEAARKTVTEKFSFDIISNDYMKLFQNLIAKESDRTFL